MKRLTLLSVLFLHALGAMAQKPITDTALKQTTIEVIQAYKPEVKAMSRPELMPDLPPADTARPAFSYNVPQQTLYYTYHSLPLRPLMLSRDTAKPPFPGYVKLGGGNLSTLYFDAGTAHLTAKNYESAIHLSHLSQEGDLKYQKTALSSLEANLNYRTSRHKWEAGIEAARNEYYNYGYNHNLYEYKATDVRNTYTSALLSLAVQNQHAYTGGIFYNPLISAGIYTDGRENTERSFNAALVVNKKLDTSFSIGLALDARLAYYQSASRSISNNVISFKPYADYSEKNIRAHIGLSPTFGKGGNAYLLPDVYLSYKLTTYALLLSAGWTASLRQNTFRELTTLNPYLIKSYETAQTRRDEIFAGAEMGMGDHISFGARFSHFSFSRLPLFLNDKGDGKDFYVIYDERVNAVCLQPFVRYQVGSALSAGVSGKFYSFTKYSGDRVWHMPATEIKADVSYRPLKKLSINAYLVALDGIYGRNTAGYEVKLPALLDVGAGVEYRLIPRLSAFGNATNIFNARNQRWLGYNAYGINILGGLRLSF